MARNPMDKVMNFVLSKYIQTERFRDGLRTGTRANFHMEATELAVLLSFYVKNQSCTVEQAQNKFVSIRDEVLNNKAHSPKEMGFFGGTLLALVLAAIPAILITLLMQDGIWTKTIALFFAMLVFMGAFFRFAWNPRRRAMNTVWNDPDVLPEKLEKLLQVQSMPIFQLIGQYWKMQAVAFFIAAVILVIALPVFSATNALDVQRFNEEMTGITVSADNAGTRYAVYDHELDRYVKAYLNDDDIAETAGDVCAVLYIREREVYSGSYEGQGNAYRRNIVVSLKDMRTGKIVMEETVYGGDPPRSIQVSSGVKNQHGYGPRPSENEITEACYSLIHAFEAVR